METVTTTNVLNLPPEALLADDNIRFTLRQDRVNSLAASILAMGGVMVPLEVEAMEVPKGEAEYRITAGHYRHAAVIKLNKEQGAGLTLPCLVVANETPLDRLKRQLEENKERENLSPMDTAAAIKKLLDLGVAKQEVRVIFSRPGGKKGNKIQPASNAFINMMLSFLDFPKKVQNKIHAGEINVAGAYTLSRVFKAKPDKFDAVVVELEAEVLKVQEEEEKDEEKYLASIKKEEEAKAKQVALAKEAEDAKSAQEKAFQEFTEQSKAEAEAYGVAKAAATATKEEKEAAEKAFKEAQEASKAKLKAAEDAKKEAEKLAAKLESVKKSAEERAKKLADIRKNADKTAKKSKAAGPAQVTAAAKKADAQMNYVPLKLAEIRDFIHTGALPATQPKVQAIFKAIEDTINGITIPKDCFKEIAKLTGETPAKK